VWEKKAKPPDIHRRILCDPFNFWRFQVQKNLAVCVGECVFVCLCVVTNRTFGGTELLPITVQLWMVSCYKNWNRKCGL
jgi:hypothetical protein